VRTLVAGCAGFIGAKVSEVLARDGHEVVGVDNLNDAYDVRLKNWRLEQIRRMPGLTVQQMDITHEGALSELGERHQFDAVVNLAARAGVRQSLLTPDLYYGTNVAGTLRLLEFCRYSRNLPPA